MHFKVFSLGQGTEFGIFFWVAKISNVFFGCLKFLIFFGGEGQMLGPSLRMQKNESTPLGRHNHCVSPPVCPSVVS